MKIKLIFLKKELETFFGVKSEYSDIYFCSMTDGNNKTFHLLKHLMDSGSCWISTEKMLDGTVTLERWLEVKGNIEKWLTKKVEEFEFLIDYNK